MPWNDYDKSYWLKHFSHVYVEEAALEYPDAQTILERFPASNRIAIRDYKHVFNRPRQDFQLQKRSMKLILAVKKDNYLYPGSAQTPNFGHANFYYNALILNCVYNCDYCYLQGMYPSANVVMFVNDRDYFKATDQALEQHPVYLCISYDTDLLAFESFLPHCRRWIEFTRSRPNLTLEIRTKCANFGILADIKPIDRVILAWTVSPESVVTRYEPSTPPLTKRLEAIRQAIEKGWNVRLCFDPILAVADWEREYSICIESIAKTIAMSKLYDISLGVFRMNNDYLQRIQEMREDSDILFHPVEKEENSSSYPRSIRQAMIDSVRKALKPHISEEKVFA